MSARCWTKMNFVQGETEIRKEFSKLDTDNSGYITKGIYQVFLNFDIDTVMNTQYCSKHLAKIVHTVKCKSAIEDRRFFYTRRGWKLKYCVIITATMSKFRNPSIHLLIFLRIFFTCFHFRRDDLRDHRLRPLFRRQGELWWRLQFSSLPCITDATLKCFFCILYFPLRSFKYFLTFQY